MEEVSWSHREIRRYVLQAAVMEFLHQVRNKDIDVGEGIGNETPMLEDTSTFVSRAEGFV